MSAALANVSGASASRTVTRTGPFAYSTVSEIRASPCSSLPSSTTNARSGSSRAISSTASATETANGVTSWPSPSSTSPSARRSSSRSLARRMRRFVSLWVPVVLVISRTFFYTSTARPRTPPDGPPCPYPRRGLLLTNTSRALEHLEHPSSGAHAARAYPADEDSREARTRADRVLLERAHRGDQQAREQLVQRFLPLARQLARRYHRGGEALDDLIQVASLGLLKAIDRFDPSRTTAFSSFAVPTILGELKRHFRDKGWSVRVPRDLQELAVKLDPTSEQLLRELGHPPTLAEIAERLDTTIELVLEAREAAAAYRAVSLDRPRDEDDDDPLGQSVGVDDPGFGVAEDAATVEQLMRVLSDREREVLRLRFVDDLTQAEIGARVGVSQMHVSRILRQAIARRREAAEEK